METDSISKLYFDIPFQSPTKHWTSYKLWKTKLSRRKKPYGGPDHYNVHGSMFVLKSCLSLQGFIPM